MKEYTKPYAELVVFGNDKLNTESSTCNCMAARWTYNQGDWDSGCEYITADFNEIADAHSLI